MGVVEQYISQLNIEKQRWKRVTAILTVLSLLVAVTVSWNLRLTGITLANDASCGLVEHQHTEDCPAEKALICGYAENLDEGIAAEHVHEDECYQITYSCGSEEHIHELSCYSDSAADLESADTWEAAIPQLTQQWAKDLVLVAQSQIGCCESESNYQVSEDGQFRNGITRYGQWYGNPYGDWASMFVMFCLNYAEIPQDSIPWSPGVDNMLRLAEDECILRVPDDNLGTIGNILFLDTDANEKADKSLIVTDGADGMLTAIGGDWDNAICEVTIPANDAQILGYINVAKVQDRLLLESVEESAEEPVEENAEEPVEESVEAPTETTEVVEPIEENSEITGDEEATTENAEESLEMTEEAGEPIEGNEETSELENEPAILLEVEFSEEEEIIRIFAQLVNMEESMFFWQWQVSEDGNEPWEDIEGAEGLTYELAATEENAIRYYRLQGHKIEAMPMVLIMTADETGDVGTETIDETDDGIITSEAVTPFSIGKNRNIYTIDVYALPVDGAGNSIEGLDVTKLNSVSVSSTTKISVQTLFIGINGIYQNAYFGSEITVDVDDIASIWRYKNGNTYYLAYAQTDGTQNQRYRRNADDSISLYLRYIPEFVVSFVSDGAATLTENVMYGNCPTLTEPGEYIRDGYALVGWTISGDSSGTVYTYDQIMAMPVTADVTYTAQWRQSVTVSFHLGEYATALYPIEPKEVSYGDTISPLPTPGWKNNSVAVAFAGWYLNQELSTPVDSSYKFYEDTILYAKWSTDDGYYIYFMDFEREEQTPLVLMTYSVAEGQTASPYTPGNVPEGTQWDRKWYLDSTCTTEYNFAIPVNQMTEYLTGANGRDLYLYPGTQDVCRAIFVTYGTKIDPVTILVGGTIDLNQYVPERYGYVFAGWSLQDGTPVSGIQVLQETTTYYATWDADYVPFEAILRIENANDTGMTQADILGTWYAKAGSQIRVKSTYTGTGNNRTGTHKVVCVLNNVEYPVYSNAALTQEATLKDVYSTYFVYNNTGTTWTDEVNWDDVYTGGEVPYSTRPISSAGDTIINFDYMRVRKDIVFTIPNTNSGGYIDIYKLQQNGLITGSVTYTGTNSAGQNVSAAGVSAQNISWSYTAATTVGNNQNNYYTLHNMKYGQRIYEVYPVGGSWLTARSAAYHQYKVSSGQYFSSRRQDLTADFFSGTGRALTPYSLTVEFKDQEYIALMYAVECLKGETPDFIHNGIGYKVNTELCEVVKHTGYFAIKNLDGCEAGVNMLGTYNSNNKYYTANTINNSNRNYATAITTAKIGDTSVYTLFNETYWPYYERFNGVNNINTFAKIYIFYYNRLNMNIQFNFGYDSNGDGSSETLTYPDIAYGERIGEYQFGKPDYQQHELLNREGYEFAGWLDANGFVLEAEDWESLEATGDSENNTMIFIAKWEKISNNIVEYYEDRSSANPFETHYFDDGELVQYPTMTVYPEGWVWQEYGAGQYQRFDWDVPMYGEYGVKEIRQINGEDVEVNVLRIYGVWDESHTKVVYDPNAAQGGITGTAPVDNNEYTIWQSEVPVMSRGQTANIDPDAVFVGWLLDRDGVVYQSGDHVSVRWPRTMIFTAQWAKAENVVHLRYDPNGGTPEGYYPNQNGFDYRKGATASVWNNTAADGSAWFSRTGHTFMGWNTQPDGSGTAYPPGSNIVLTESMTTLYAQWRKDTHGFSVHKVDYGSNASLAGAVFELYKYENGEFLPLESLTTGTDGRITFAEIETGSLYKLVEARPPDGYAIITKDIYFRLVPGANAVSLEFCDSGGNTASTPSGVSGEYISGSRYLFFTIANVAGFELPATGGIGIPIYILFGVIFIFAPFIYGFRMRCRFRKEVKK